MNRRNFIFSTAVAAAAAGTICSAQKSETSALKSIETDICVLGGSCTGTFAAVRAAQLGAKVVLVEKQNCFGGVATSSLINVWHTLYDTIHQTQIIGGLTEEVINRLKKRNAVKNYENDLKGPWALNSQELKIELDELVLENKITPLLHTLFSEPVTEDEKLLGVIVDNKSGRSIIKAKQFIDCTGDADLCFRLGIDHYTFPMLQPPTTAAHFNHFDFGLFNKTLKEHGKEFGIPSGFVWGATVPGSQTVMISGTRIYGVDCSVADELTKAEIEGRRQIRAMQDMLRKYHPDKNFVLTALPSYTGVRETRHIKSLYQVSDDDGLYGKRFDDAIANGSYVFDQHHQDKPGITFKELDGTYRYTGGTIGDEEYPATRGRWREETETNPTFYQIPLRSIVPLKFNNLMMAGRMFDAGIVAFSGMRVMVNMNQLGEAAGVASYLALHQNKPVQKIDAAEVRKVLKDKGAVII
ncbi:MAG: FAD-dependent oxidoreductase [Planctomycetaceae bacterium]|nr:FAD-dependent oxidoreductase [Planctomycetaceae bacterium]